jgi:hypothetical protein
MEERGNDSFRGLQLRLFGLGFANARSIVCSGEFFCLLHRSFLLLISPFLAAAHSASFL